MDSERENKSKDCNVKDLQANLFPLFPKMSGYFANYMIKSEPEEDPDEALKLRGSGSRDLFAINRESNYQAQSARWPTECQVLDEKIEHINYVPFVPESYYAASGLENQPKPSGDENGIIVYQYAPISAVNYFSRSSIGGSKYLLSTNICPEENTLKFESRFESGNLARAIRLTPNYYELHLRSDLYTHRYMQWFYFRITDMKKNFLYRFSIVNFTKDGSLYNSGLRPLMYSVKDSQLHSIGWRRCGDQITYFSNENLPEEYEDSQTTYTLTFTILFPHDQDTVYLASCYPYTYTNLQDYLTELSNHPVKSTYTTLRLLCKSLAGNNVNYITITSTPEELEENKKKRAIVITGRVHPGETPSSWMMKGFIDFLTSDTSAAKELRDKFIFKIVPMLNPDGVIVGNNRCSLSGKDLNRQYRTVMREAYPSIWYTKLMVRRLIEECGVSLYCDLHGHSRKHNIFIYGCENRGRAQDKRLLEQIFPLMLHKNTADKFSFEDCSFRIQKGKEGTGRVVMWMMGITNSYTLEASFAGSTLGNRNKTHFSILDYELMGKSFCQTLLDFYDEEPKKEKLRLKILNRLSQEGSNADEPTNIMLSDYSSDDGSHQSSSEENIGDFNYSNKLITVPPSSPLLICPKAKPRRPKHKLNVKHQENARKPLQMRKASLTLSLSETNFNFCTESSSLDSDEDKSKPVSLKSRRKTHKKKHDKKKTQTFVDLSANKLFKIENNLKDIVENVIRTRSRLFLMWTEIDNLRDDNVRLGVKLDIIEQKLQTIRNIVDLEDLDVRELVQIISEELLDPFITEIETSSERESRDTPRALELRSMRTVITAMATISDSEGQNFPRVLNFNSNTTLVEDKEPACNSDGSLTVTESESITVSPSMRQLLIESECGKQDFSSQIQSEFKTTVITSHDTERETSRENQNENKEDTTETFATGESEDDFRSLSFKSCDGTRVAGIAEEDRAKNVTANDDHLLSDLRKALNFSIMNKPDINSTRIAIASSTERMLFINELLEKLTSNTSSLVKLDEC